MVALTGKGKLSRVYMSSRKEDLDDLTNYSDPLGLSDTLESFSYDFNGEGTGTYQIELRCLNPQQEFEKTFLRLYQLLFYKDRTQSTIEDAPDNLTYFFRWGYGDSEEDGLSRIITGKLIDITYDLNSTTQRAINLQFVDNITFNSTVYPGHDKDVRTTRTVSVNCLVDGGVTSFYPRFKRPGAVVGELLGSLYGSFVDNKVGVSFYSDKSVGEAIDNVYGALTKFYSTGDLNPQAAVIERSRPEGISGLYKEIEETVAKGGTVEVDFGSSWEDHKVSSRTPSFIHRLAAYRTILEEFGIGVIVGIEENALLSQGAGEESLAKIKEDSASMLAAANASLYNKTFEALDIIIDDSSRLFELDSGEFVGVGSSIFEIKQSGEAELFFRGTTYEKGNVYFRPMGKAVTLGEADSIVGGVSNYNATTLGIKTPYSFRVKTKYAILPSIQTKIQMQGALMSAYAHGVTENEQTFAYEIRQAEENIYKIQAGDFYLHAYITKETDQKTPVVARDIINSINKIIVPATDDPGVALDVIQVAAATLIPEERANIAKIVRVPFEDKHFVTIISSRENIRTSLGGLTDDSLILNSFPSLQEGNVLNLIHGGDDSIITEINFNQSIFAAFPSMMINFDTFRSLKELFFTQGELNSYSDIRTILYSEVANSYNMLKVNSFSVIKSLERLQEEGDFTSFINKYQAFITAAENNELGPEMDSSKIITNSVYATAFIRMIKEGNLGVLFNLDEIREFTYDDGDGTINSESNSYASVSLNEDLLNKLYRLKDTQSSDMHRALLYDLLYGKFPFQMSITTLGIPELSNPLFDMPNMGNRKVHLQVKEVRSPGSNNHWLSGYYKILGYTHRYDMSNGYTMDLNIWRYPHYSRGSVFNVR